METAQTPTTVPGTTTSTLIGPNGTAPGLNFIEQPQKALNDSSGEGAGLPLFFAGVVFLVVFSVVFLRAWLRKQRNPSTR